MPVAIRPYTVRVPEETLTDLRDRLARTRWPDEVEDVEWGYGIPLGYMKGLVEYWRGSFDWRAQEARLNEFPNYRADIDGFGVHVIHARGRGPSPLPLLMTHGWPSSVAEMLDLIPLLTDPGAHGGDPADAFDVVVPSLPGYGFSDRPTRRGVPGPWYALWARLMEGLGYDRYGMHAGDVGAAVSSRLALAYPDRVVGYHTPEPQIMPSPYLSPGARPLTDAERAYRRVQERFDDVEGGYHHIQATRPQALAYGLNDSPAGLTAWILDKWYTWTAPPGGDLEVSFTRDQLLANVTVYWATQTINSANRTYYADGHWRDPDASRIASASDHGQHLPCDAGDLRRARG